MAFPRWHIYLNNKIKMKFFWNLTSKDMIATLGNNAMNNLKPGAVLTVTGAKSATEAQKEIADFLMSNHREDLDYFLISKNYFLIYSKAGQSVSAVA